AVIATICELFFPVTAIILDYIINDQKLSWVQWVSAVILLLAIINLNLANSRRAATWSTWSLGDNLKFPFSVYSE
ncbi:MAG: hypothetical protein KAJ50_11065, partial [Bacteroidales bacterium]|nr:hypothetical protein [Bacteroidales bacterium]